MFLKARAIIGRPLWFFGAQDAVRPGKSPPGGAACRKNFRLFSTMVCHRQTAIGSVGV
jgi:hypothetical protein